MRWLQWTLFLLAKSVYSQNSSAFHFSHLEDVSSGTAMEEENATGETSQSSQVRSDQNTIVILHPGFASLHSRPSPAFSVQWTRSCRIWRGLPCIERSYPAKVLVMVSKTFMRNSSFKSRKAKLFYLMRKNNCFRHLLLPYICKWGGESL